MSCFAKTLADRVDGYVTLHRSLGYSFRKQAATLRALVRFVEAKRLDGPLTQAMALDFVVSWDGSANGRAIRYGVVRRLRRISASTIRRPKYSMPRRFPGPVQFRRPGS
ncbi:hypothetical protein [Sinorhizobium meliloti]|uniref:hypothetical protein n=1 Tax=Rhizobium meliloti TaxID=382 RepID=UPI001F473864|nr:hypothetical protein [Sinorhizobium meliloti]